MQELRSELLSSSSPRPSSASQGWGSWQARPLCVNLCPLHPGSLLLGKKDKPRGEGGHGRSRLRQEPREAFSPLPSQLPFTCLIPQRPRQSDYYQCLSQKQGHHSMGCGLMALLEHPKEVDKVNRPVGGLSWLRGLKYGKVNVPCGPDSKSYCTVWARYYI